MNGRVLIADDDRDMCELIESALSGRGFEVSWHTDAVSAFASLKTDTFDAVLTDLRMPGMDGIDLCARIVANRPDLPVVVMTAFGNLDSAVAAIRAGAYDFVTKPVEMQMLALTLQRAIEHRSLREQIKRLSEAVRETGRFEKILGNSPAMRDLYDRLSRVSDSEASVLIRGESGTGKELVARALHQNSRRRDKPFVALNCAALPDNLMESELFGHTRGAFTDAAQARKGLIFEADGGTLFFDEIGDMPAGLQPKLLRALEERRVRPVGANREEPFDVRVVCASNRDLESAVEEGRFREDLYFRINVIQINLPPLRARGADVLLLAQHFTEQFAATSGKPIKGLSRAVAEKLTDYAWPGNIRELRNAIEHAVALTAFEELTVEDLPQRIRAYERSQMILGGPDPAELVPMEELERRYIRHVMHAVDDNKTSAARILGMDRKTLYRKLQQYDVAGDDTGA